MARIRMVKPEFFDDPDMGELTPMARLLFIGLWTQADREGRLEADLRRLKARIFPYDTVDMEALAVELHGRDMIRRYSDDRGRAYIWIRSFTKHQRPHPKEPASVIPEWSTAAALEPCKNTARRVKDIPSQQSNGVLILDPLESNGTRKLESGTRILEHAVKGTASRGKVNGNGSGRSPRPIFKGQRITVFEWMLDDMARVLGPHADAFNLHEWFFAVDTAAAQNDLMPKEEQWTWLQAQLLIEAQQRGLPITPIPHTTAGKQTAGRKMQRVIAEIDALAMAGKKVLN